MTIKKLTTTEGVEMDVNTDLIVFVKEINTDLFNQEYSCRLVSGDNISFTTNPFAEG